MLIAFASEPASFLTVNIRTELVSDGEFALTFERTANLVVFSPLLLMFASRILRPYISAVSTLAIAPIDLSPDSATVLAANAVFVASSALKPLSLM